jgi:amino acid transporter
LSYIELGLMFKRNGGSYTYIKETFGPAFAFMNVFVNIILLRPAGQAIMTMTFANYALYLLFDDGCGEPPEYLSKMVAVALIRWPLI